MERKQDKDKEEEQSLELKHQQKDIKKDVEDKENNISIENFDEGLKAILEELTEYAKLVTKDYKENPSEVSGSIYYIDEDSLVLEE